MILGYSDGVGMDIGILLLKWDGWGWNGCWNTEGRGGVRMHIVGILQMEG